VDNSALVNAFFRFFSLFFGLFPTYHPPTPNLHPRNALYWQGFFHAGVSGVGGEGLLGLPVYRSCFAKIHEVTHMWWTHTSFWKFSRAIRRDRHLPTPLTPFFL